MFWQVNLYLFAIRPFPTRSLVAAHAIAFSVGTTCPSEMRSLQLPREAQLRPKSLALLEEVGVKISRTEDGYRFEYPIGVEQVVTCILETEKNLSARQIVPPLAML
jgi:hypothetical protein